jgi:hypothetical protein
MPKSLTARFDDLMIDGVFVPIVKETLFTSISMTFLILVALGFVWFCHMVFDFIPLFYWFGFRVQLVWHTMLWFVCLGLLKVAYDLCGLALYSKHTGIPLLREIGMGTRFGTLIYGIIALAFAYLTDDPFWRTLGLFVLNFWCALNILACETKRVTA